jgi:outer membrane PBP1 activator LpoA protein
MLHVPLRGRQVPGWLLATLVIALLAATPITPARAARADDLAAAGALASEGRHAEAAAAYESLGKRRFRGWDERVALLSAREYLLAGRLDDAERLLAFASPAESRDDTILLARVSAEVAIARGRPQAALDALLSVPEPWPPAVANELLALRTQAEFSAGRLLEGVRTTERRAQLLANPDARRSVYAGMLEGLVASPASAMVPAGATPDEAAWFELAQMLAQPDAAAAARRSVEWRARHPDHPGAQFLPQAADAAAREQVAGALTAPGATNAIALLLPLSGKQAAAGVAVRDGFIAAALAEEPERRPRIDLYDTAELGAAAAYQKAVTGGARAVAGPLLKEDIAALVAATSLSVPTVALNSVPGDTPPPFLFQFSLDPEQEAREAARRIAADGLMHGIALFPANAWGDRLQAAFTSELAAHGVQLTAIRTYDPASKDYSGALRAALGRFGGAGDRDAKGALRPRDAAAEFRDGPQFAFIAAMPQAARAICPQLRFQMAYTLPVYMTSDAWDSGSRAVPDLDGVRLPQMPWVLAGGSGAPALWDALQKEWSAVARGRQQLYAFGFDAYQLLAGLNIAARGVAVDGLTGRLTLGPDGRVQRGTEWAQVENGRLQPAGALALPAAPSEP